VHEHPERWPGNNIHPSPAGRLLLAQPHGRGGLLGAEVRVEREHDGFRWPAGSLRRARVTAEPSVGGALCRVLVQPGGPAPPAGPPVAVPETGMPGQQWPRSRYI
jgi:hypothetical protein